MNVRETMFVLPSSELPIWSNTAIFCVAAIGVWICGTRLSVYIDIGAERTGLGKAFAGALLLGGATSLPEIATTITASSSGATTMAGTNLIGGIAMQLGVLAILDLLLIRNRALTFFSPKAALLMHGVMLIGLLAMIVAAISVGELVVVGGVGGWSVALCAGYVIALFLVYRYEDRSRWEPSGEVAQPPESAKDMKDAQLEKYQHVGLAGLALRFVCFASGVLLFGVFVAKSGEILAQQTGLGQGLVGAVLVALATSLPELSTTWSAVRFGAYSMAVANIFGTNCLEVALFLPADLANREAAIITALDPSASFLAAMGIATTAVYLWGILERRDRTILGMGYDSAVVLLIYIIGMLIYARSSVL